MDVSNPHSLTQSDHERDAESKNQETTGTLKKVESLDVAAIAWTEQLTWTHIVPYVRMNGNKRGNVRRLNHSPLLSSRTIVFDIVDGQSKWSHHISPFRSHLWTSIGKQFPSVVLLFIFFWCYQQQNNFWDKIQNKSDYICEGINNKLWQRSMYGICSC